MSKSTNLFQLGTAENTAFVQSWLNFCPAVIGWEETSADKITFRFYSAIEVHAVPANIVFGDN